MAAIRGLGKDFTSGTDLTDSRDLLEGSYNHVRRTEMSCKMDPHAKTNKSIGSAHRVEQWCQR